MLFMHQSWLQVLVLSPSTSCLEVHSILSSWQKKKHQVKREKKNKRGRDITRRRINAIIRVVPNIPSDPTIYLPLQLLFEQYLSSLFILIFFSLIPSLFFDSFLLPSLPASGSVSIHSSVTENHREKKLPMISQVVQFYSETVYSLSGGCSLPSFYMKND